MEAVLPVTAPVSVPLLDELEAARAKATPGVWEVDEDGDVIAGADPDTFLVTGVSSADAACIVAERNAVPKLTAALRAVWALADELDKPVSGGPADGMRPLYGGGDVCYRIRAVLASALGEEGL